MIWLHVPYPERDEAKARGARWHVERRQWFAPSGLDHNLFAAWLEERPQVHASEPERQRHWDFEDDLPPREISAPSPSIPAESPARKPARPALRVEREPQASLPQPEDEDQSLAAIFEDAAWPRQTKKRWR